ncbi:MAG: hypothetical protein PWQ12_1846 [Clostridiales bacterium]|jgi:hypothetical protein|nr:hypothetical protein [Clostridiales bacterium]
MQFLYGIAAINAAALFYGGYHWMRREGLYAVLPGLRDESGRHLKHQYAIRQESKKRQVQLSKNFYRIYKYMYVQSVAGTRTEDVFKSLHKVVTPGVLKSEMLQFSVIMAQSHDVKKALDYLRGHFRFEEGEVFISIMESVLSTGLPPETLLRLDNMLFQKYLSHLRRQTDRIKRLYLGIVIIFTIVTSTMLLFPLIDQAFRSADMIFN